MTPIAPNDGATEKLTPESLFRLPVGAASPFWGVYAGAALSGVAWWWMTRWSRPANLEALFGGQEATVPAPLTAVAVVEPLVEAVEQLAQEAQAVVESAAEQTSAAITEAVPAAAAVVPEPAAEPAAETIAAPAEAVTPAEPITAAGVDKDDEAGLKRAAPKSRKPAAATDEPLAG